MDYFVAVILVLVPWLLDFAGQNSATYVMVALGLSTVAYSMITNYEWGAAKIIPMPSHLRLDLVSGVILALSPWLFGFNIYIYLPHVVLGVLEVIVSLLTATIPYEGNVAKLLKKRARILSDSRKT
jgi:hypothetical protein